MKTVSADVIRVIRSDDKAHVQRVFSRRAQRLDEAERAVLPIIAAVKREGDRALVRFAKRWDGFTGTASGLAVSAKDIAGARDAVGESFLRAVRDAAWNIREYCRFQMPKSWQRRIRPGIEVGQLIRPLDSVGCYIPGGRYPLPSTLLMTAIPAQVAGVERVAVCTPRPNPEIFATASELDISEIYTVGGAHAIAALAYGTKTISAVSKIVGPGSAYVAAAKRLVARDTAIDFVAGPTEVLLIASDGDPAWIAADLLAQAEHDVDATALLLTPSAKLAREVAAEVRKQLVSLNGTAAAISLKKNCAIVIVRDLKEAVALANRFAPEHLSVPADLGLEKIRNAGSVFVGPFSPEAAGDYASGPNHVLPTGGMARLRGGLSVLDFVKVVSVQKLTESGLRSITPSIVNLARSEGLEAHARSVEIRSGTNSPQRAQRAQRTTIFKKSDPSSLRSSG
ncbi:MAG: histidinol dehydrogenase [Acidobacteria bacterium]|nr:histidinol dehydrogenase [Acidobacteriota bacterium]